MAAKDPDDLLDALRQRALEEAGSDEPEDVDVVAAAARGSLSDAEASAARDVTLGGYIDLHNRPPAFAGSDGQPYTVDVDTEQTDAADFAAFLVFLRWAETGAGIMDHLETGDVARGATEEEARQAALQLSLYEVKAELDAAIARRLPEQEE